MPKLKVPSTDKPGKSFSMTQQLKRRPLHSPDAASKSRELASKITKPSPRRQNGLKANKTFSEAFGDSDDEVSQLTTCQNMTIHVKLIWYFLSRPLASKVVRSVGFV